MALNKTMSFDLELKPGGIPPIIHASQGDIGRMFKANIYWDGSAATSYVSGATVNLRGKKPDKTVFDYTATLAGSMVTFETTEQMTIISGPVECELVFSNDGDIIASANFVLMVEDSPYNPDAPSESVIPGIEDLIEQTIGGDVSDEVDAWLDAHPEVTTTVQDGAITKAKINTAFLPEIENAYVTPETFGEGATDADLLEYSINNLPAGGTLVIDREYILNRDIVISRNSSGRQIRLIGTGKNSAINTAEYHITGSLRGNTGNILFSGINFKSTGSIFDGYYLIRMYFRSCVFANLGSIAYNSNANADNYIQSYYFQNCEIRRLSGYIIESGYNSQYRTYLIDVNIIGCLIEWCNAGIFDAKGYSGVHVENNCIEGFVTETPLIANCREGNNLAFRNNYCESNHTTYVDFTNMNASNPVTFLFEGNNIYEHVNKEFGIIKTGALNQSRGYSIYNVCDNTFNTEPEYGGTIYMIDASAATENLNNWCVWNNNIFNGYMTPKKDPNNHLTIYKNVNTFNEHLQYRENANGIVYTDVHENLTIGGPLVTTYGKVVNFYAFITVTETITNENPTIICKWINGWQPDIPSGRYNLTPLYKSSSQYATLWVDNIGIKIYTQLATGTYYLTFTYLKQ